MSFACCVSLVRERQNFSKRLGMTGSLDCASLRSTSRGSSSITAGSAIDGGGYHREEKDGAATPAAAPSVLSTCSTAPLRQGTVATACARHCFVLLALLLLVAPLGTAGVTAAGAATVVAGVCPVIFFFAFGPVVPRALRVARAFSLACAFLSTVGFRGGFFAYPKSTAAWLLGPSVVDTQSFKPASKAFIVASACLRAARAAAACPRRFTRSFLASRHAW